MAQPRPTVSNYITFHNSKWVTHSPSKNKIEGETPHKFLSLFLWASYLESEMAFVCQSNLCLTHSILSRHHLILCHTLPLLGYVHPLGKWYEMQCFFIFNIKRDCRTRFLEAFLACMDMSRAN
jgi:hypothetical protein